MQILLINDNKIVSRLISLTCEKNSIDFEEIQEINNASKNSYDFIFIDSDIYTQELLEEIENKLSFKKLIFIASKGAEIPQSIEVVLEKPFLPTDFLELIQKQSSYLQESEELPENEDEKESDSQTDEMIEDITDLDEKEETEEFAKENFDFDFSDLESEIDIKNESEKTEETIFEETDLEETEKENEEENKEEFLIQEEEKEENLQAKIEKEFPDIQLEEKENEEEQNQEEILKEENEETLRQEEEFLTNENKTFKETAEDEALLDQISQEIADKFNGKEHNAQESPFIQENEIKEEERKESVLDKEDIEQVKQFLEEEESDSNKKEDIKMYQDGFASLTQEALLEALQDINIKEENIEINKSSLSKEEIYKEKNQESVLKEEAKAEETDQTESQTEKEINFQESKENTDKTSEKEKEPKESIEDTLEKAEIIKKVLEEMEINITISFKRRK